MRYNSYNVPSIDREEIFIAKIFLMVYYCFLRGGNQVKSDICGL